MTDDLKRPPRGLLSNSPVQPVHVDALLNALADITMAQASLADAVSRICVAMARSEDQALSAVVNDISSRLGTVGGRLESAIRELRVIRDNVK